MCLTTAPTLNAPLTINSKPGLIKLKTTGTVFFDPSQTDVITTAGDKVSYTCTAQALSFTADPGKSYFLEILHGGSMDNSVGDLQEDCTPPVKLATLSAANTFARYKVVVSQGA